MYKYKLISRLNYPVEIKYNNESIILSPKAKLSIKDKELLGELPQGVMVKEVN